MAIHGSDNRTQVTNFGTPGNSSVVSVDALRAAPTAAVPQTPQNLVTTGVQVADNFFLTAGHSVFDSGATVAAGRITAGSNTGALASRPSTALSPSDVNFTAASITYPDNYPASASLSRDIALVQTSGGVGATSMGMVVYMDSRDARGIPITTTGFPAAPNAPGTVTTTPVDPVIPWLNQATLAYTSSGSIARVSADGQFGYTNSVDTEGGQSGSGVWTMVDDGSGTMVPAIVGVHTNSGNGGHLITQNEYRAITDAMDGNVANPGNLPMSVLVGTAPSFFSFVGIKTGVDYIQGSFLDERILGKGGDDRIEGRGGDDLIEGDGGVDQALFSGTFSDYDFTILNAANPQNLTMEFKHVRGSATDGTDKTTGVEFAVFEYSDADNDGVDDNGETFFVPLMADADDPTKLKDGPKLQYVEPAKDVDGNKVGDVTVNAPAFMFDGDISYNINIGAEQNILYNFVYIIDVSGSMRGNNLAQTQAAYVALTQSLITQGIADKSNFAVVNFNSSAWLTSGLDAQGVINTINALVAGGGTSFGPALAQAEGWFESLRTSELQGASNIAYFLSDGFGGGASDSLQLVGETLPSGGETIDVRAYGIGAGADLDSLNIIDSNNAVLLTDPNDLVEAFASGEIQRDKIDRIDVRLGGVVVDTIAPASLVDDPLGLKYEGTLSGLEVSRTAENELRFDVVFNDGTPTVSVDAKVTTGQSEVITQSDDGTEVVVTFSVNLADYDATGLAEAVQRITINGNDLANTITVDSGINTIFGHGGNDRFIINGGQNVVDGGDGDDTAVFSNTLFADANLSSNGAVVSVGDQQSFVDVEYLQFADALVDTRTLAPVPMATLANSEVIINESDADTASADFTINLDSPATEDVVISYATRAGSALEGDDYTPVSGEVTILAGETSATVSVNVINDAELESNEYFLVDFTIQNGAVFQGQTASATGAVGIESDDAYISFFLSGTGNTILEGGSGEEAVITLTVQRTGSVSGEDVVSYAVAGDGSNPATADDFVGGLPTGTVTFAAGETTKEIEIKVVGDGTLEPDETFSVTLAPVSGTGDVQTTPQIITIVNDDVDGGNGGGGGGGGTGDGTIIGTDRNDVLRVTDAVNVVTTLAGRDTVRGSASEFNGDTVTDFSNLDRIRVIGTEFDRSAVSFGNDAAAVAINPNSSLSLQGDFTGGDFMVVAQGGNTQVTFAHFLPDLNDGRQVANADINGIVNPDFLAGNGVRGFELTLQDAGYAKQDNAIGVYEIDGDGNIVDVRILIDDANEDKSASVSFGGVEAGNKLGFFIVQDGADWAGALADTDELSFVNAAGSSATLADGADLSLAVNGTASDVVVFHSHAQAMNADGVEHALSGVAAGGEALLVGFEDLTGGGDRDYEDVVFRVDIIDEFAFA